jgi:beta-lactam-binding protein with PASTA domain
VIKSDSEYFLKFIPRKSLWFPLTVYLAFPVFCLFVLFFIADLLIMPAITRHSSEKPLPSVVGMSLTEARETLDEVGAQLEIAGEEPSPTLPEGTVMTQSPRGGSMVKSGRRVKVITSAGREMAVVPNLVGFSQRQCNLKLREAGLEIGGTGWAASDSLPINVLVYSIPAAGSTVPKSTEVNLFFNRGSQSTIVTVPQLVGMNLYDAEKTVDSLGLNIAGVDYAVKSDLLPNTVIWQSVNEGTKVELGSALDLKVSVTD